SRVDVEDRNSPGVFLVRIELHVVVRTRQAFSLGFHAEVVGNFFAHTLAPGIAEFGREERVSVELLAAVAVEAISTDEFGVAVFGCAGCRVDVLRNQEAARTSDGLAL